VFGVTSVIGDAHTRYDRGTTHLLLQQYSRELQLYCVYGYIGYESLIAMNLSLQMLRGPHVEMDVVTVVRVA
jgi:hypothetical protein